MRTLDPPMGGLGPSLILFLLHIVGWQMASGLHITSLRVPSTVRAGSNASLSCSFSLDGDVLYSLTWWKDDHMLLRFLPEDVVRPMTVNPTPGIIVNKRLSSLHEVILSRVDHRASGRLRCEVLAANFDRSTKDANMTVIDPPSRGPYITGHHGQQYRVGDLLLLNCTSSYSFPATTLTWAINGRQASRETIVLYPGEGDSEGRMRSCSGLQMHLTRQHFQDGVVVLRCTAVIFNVYSNTAEVAITDASSYQHNSPREGASTEGGGSCSSWMVSQLLLLSSLLLGTLVT